MDMLQQKPQLPASFYQHSKLGTTCFILFMMTMFLMPGYLAYLLLCYSDLPAWLSLTMSLPLFILSGQGIHLMGWIGHDGLHFTLHENRIVSAIIGVFFSAGTVTFLEMGMALDHWTHHRYTNKPEDPDLRMFEKYKSFWSRMLFSRIRSNRHYVRRVYKLVTGQPLDEELTKIILPFELSTIRKLAWFNIFSNLFWAAAYLLIAFVDMKAFLIMVLVPMVVALCISGLRPYIEHNGTQSEEFNNTRTRTSPVWTFLDFGGNYHFEHHMYPSVPQWRLPKLHRYLKAQGYMGTHYDDTALSHYRYATSTYQYPKGI